MERASEHVELEQRLKGETRRTLRLARVKATEMSGTERTFEEIVKSYCIARLTTSQTFIKSFMHCGK